MLSREVLRSCVISSACALTVGSILIVDCTRRMNLKGLNFNLSVRTVIADGDGRENKRDEVVVDLGLYQPPSTSVIQRYDQSPSRNYESCLHPKGRGSTNG